MTPSSKYNISFGVDIGAPKMLLNNFTSTVSKRSNSALVRLNHVSLLHNTLLTNRVFLNIIATSKNNFPKGMPSRILIIF